MLHKTFTFACVVIGASAQLARAQPAVDPASPPPDITAPTSDPIPAAEAPLFGGDAVEQLTLPRGRLVLEGFLEINLSDGAVFKPFSITPDLWYGATPEITVGLIHSTRGATGFIGGFGDALCLVGEDNGCGELYPGFGVDVRYPVKTGQLSWAADGGLFFRSLDPVQLAVKLGAVARYRHSDKIVIEASPNLFIGLTNREPEAMGLVVAATNGEVLNLPVTGLYEVAPKISVSLQLGVVLPFQNTGDFYAIPLSIGGHYVVDQSLAVNAAFSLPVLIGGSDAAGVDIRSLTLGGTYAF